MWQRGAAHFRHCHRWLRSLKEIAVDQAPVCWGQLSIKAEAGPFILGLAAAPARSRAALKVRNDRGASAESSPRSLASGCVHSGDKTQRAEVTALNPVPDAMYLLPKSNAEGGRDGLRRLVSCAGILNAHIIVIQVRE